VPTGPHLICHSACEGQCLSADFHAPAYGEKKSDAAYMGPGPSVAGLRELVQAAPPLGIE
jgi:hypothetical protein